MIKSIFISSLLLLGQASLCRGQVEFRIAPPIIEINLGRGGTKVFDFELSNDNKEKSLRFSILPMDLETDRAGNVEFLEIGKSVYSCSNWITLESKEVVLEPGKSKRIPVKLTLPAAVPAGGYYSAIVCELIPEKPSKVQAGAVIRWRIATLIKVTVLGGKLEKKATFEDFSLRTLFEKEEEHKGLTFVASLNNHGNIHIKATGRLVILTPDRKRKGEIDFDVGTGTVLPGHIRDFVAVYDKFLPEGTYIARATFRYEGMSTLEKEIPFSLTVEKSTPGQEESVTITTLKLIPEKIALKIPKGGFRTVGFTIQNQKLDNLRIRLSLNETPGIQDWLSLETQEVEITGGAKTKILIKCSIPPNAKEGKYETNIKLRPFLINAQGQEEPLDAATIGVTLEVPEL
jgi:hypothetical protein